MEFIQVVLKYDADNVEDAVKSLERQFTAPGPAQLAFVEAVSDPYDFSHPVQHPRLAEEVEAHS